MVSIGFSSKTINPHSEDITGMEWRKRNQFINIISLKTDKNINQAKSHLKTKKKWKKGFLEKLPENPVP